MKLMLHMARKDLLQLRWGILLWCVVLAIPVATGFALLSVDDPSPLLRGLGDGLLQVIGGFLTGALVCGGTVLLVQSESLVGSRQFWTTRPIARWRLLGSKLLVALLLLGVVPNLVALPWWLWCGFGPRELLEAAAANTALLCLVAIPAACVGVVTDSLLRGFVWTLVALVLSFLALVWTIARSGSITGPLAFSSSNYLATVAVGLAGMAAIVVGRYLFRQWWRIVVLPAVVILVGATTTANLPRLWRALPDTGSGIQVRFDSANLPTPTRTAREKQPSQREVALTFTVDPLPPGRGLWLEPSPVVVGWRDGSFSEALYAWGRTSGFSLVSPLDEFRSLAQVGGQMERAGQPSTRNRGRAGLEFRVPAPFFERIEREQPRLATRMRFAVVSPVLVNEAPLAPGGWHAAKARGLRVVDVAESTEGRTLRLLWSVPVSRLPQPLRLPGPPRETLLLIDRDRGDYEPLTVTRPSRNEILGVQILRADYRLDKPANSTPAGDWNAWLKGVRIAQLVLDFQSSFSRTFDLPGTEVWAKKPSGDGQSSLPVR